MLVKLLAQFWPYYEKVLINKSSTFFLAQGVFLKNFKLDFTLGLILKQSIFIALPNSSQPKCCSNRVTTCSKVMPCRGLFFCCGISMYKCTTFKPNAEQSCFTYKHINRYTNLYLNKKPLSYSLRGYII